MSVSSELPLASNVLLLFKSDLREQHSELTCAIDRTRKEIRAFDDSAPGDVIDDSSGNSSKEEMFATYTENRRQLRKIEAALERLATGEYGICDRCGGTSASNDCEHCLGRTTASSARSNPSKADCSELIRFLRVPS
jgi:RNA polymerase-binding transcription factor DksA